MSKIQSSPHYKGAGDISKISLKENEDVDLPNIKVPQATGEVRIKPKGLDIIWGGDDRYWKWITKDNPDKTEKIVELELVQVCWLEVSGSASLSLLEKDTFYQLQFKLRMKPDAFGWNSCPVYVMIKVGNDNRKWKKVNLGQNTGGSQSFNIPTDFTFKTPPTSDEKDKLLFGLYEIWTGRWKGGLVIEEVFISKLTT